MKRTKNIVKVLAIGSIFLITAVSFTGVISLQDSNLYSFWSVKKINYSFVTKSYADDDEDEHEYESKKRYEDKEDDENDEDEDERKSKSKSSSSSSSNNTTTVNASTSGNTSSNSSSCYIVYDSRTTASGVNVVEPVQVCDTNNGTTTQITNNNSSVDTTKIEAITNKTKVSIQPTVTKIATQNSDNSSISVAEKNKISVLFLTFKIKLNKTNYTDSKKLVLFKKVDVLINDKINTLNKNILTIKDQALLKKSQKKVLLLKEVKLNIQSQLLVYQDAVNTKLKNELVTAQIAAANKSATQVTTQNTAAANAAAQKAAQTAAANAAAQKAAQTAAANAAAQKAAQTAAANAAAQKAVNTTTSAS